MHLNPITAFLVVLASVTASAIPNDKAVTNIAARDQYKFQVNYYKDGGCTEYNIGFTPNTYGAYSYYDPGTNSANIADCFQSVETHCSCTFYTEDHQQGTAVVADWYGNNCASAWGKGFKSMYCKVWGLNKRGVEEIRENFAS
jgi:hypothetical protein